MAHPSETLDILARPFPPEDPALLPEVLAAFTDHYRQSAIMMGPEPAAGAQDTRQRLPLSAALAMETVLCQAQPERRQSPVARIHWMAGNLAAAGSLAEDHSHFLAAR